MMKKTLKMTTNGMIDHILYYIYIFFKVNDILNTTFCLWIL